MTEVMFWVFMGVLALIVIVIVLAMPLFFAMAGLAGAKSVERSADEPSCCGGEVTWTSALMTRHLPFRPNQTMKVSASSCVPIAILKDAFDQDAKSAEYRASGLAT